MEATQVFEILARENTPMLMAYLSAGVTDRAAVDDLYQETMLVAWRKLDQFDANQSFAAWIRGIAHLLMLQHYRSTAKQHLRLNDNDLHWIEERFLQIENLSGDSFSEKIDLLRDCVAQLPAPYRQAIELRYEQGKKLDEASRLLQLSLETLKKRLVRARVRLSQCIDRKMETAEGLA